MEKYQPWQGEVVDLFCGVGALSHGLMNAGLKVLAGYDIDRGCKYAFENNNNAPFHTRDVSTLTAREIRSHFSGTLPSVIAGCAPCQPFSTYKQRYNEDPQWELVTKFADLAVAAEPDFITMENVPELVRYKGGRVFRSFLNTLEAAQYKFEYVIAKCENFGVPQRRRRLVVLASKNSNILPLQETHETYITVKDAISRLPKLSAGQKNPDDALHASSALSDINLKRIRASRPGGTWHDWPKELLAECHLRQSGKTYSGVYARMSWDKPAPTITTQSYGYGNGRFGHPEQDRAISLREAAILQSFPDDYKFVEPGSNIYFKTIGRWIGNAVPVKLAEAIGTSIVRSNDQPRG